MNSLQDNKFTFPECWQDDMRMNALFAPFRARSVNPSDWESKMKFWAPLIEQWCIYHKTPLVDSSVLSFDFRRKGQTPSCLNQVLYNLKSNKTLISKDTFYQITQLKWKDWFVQVLITNPLKWTYNKVTSTITRNTNSGNVYIHYPALMKLGEDVYEGVPDNEKGKLITVKHAQEISNIKDHDFQLLLQWLCSQQLAATCEHRANLLVKFPKTRAECVTITNTDKTLFSLESTSKILQDNINRLEIEKENYMKEARQHAAEKKLAMAKANLRRKRATENVINKLIGAMKNIDNLTDEIHMAQMNSAILDCYQSGVSALNRYLEENGLTMERITEAKNDLRDVLILKNNIDIALSESVDQEDDDTYLEELNNLLAEETMKDETELDKALDKLPDVPRDTPESVNNLEKKLASLAL